MERHCQYFLNYSSFLYFVKIFIINEVFVKYSHKKYCYMTNNYTSTKLQEVNPVLNYKWEWPRRTTLRICTESRPI